MGLEPVHLGKYEDEEGAFLKSCFFIGHRTASENILPALTAAVEQHITVFGVTEFIVGGYGEFDRMAAAAVIAAKRRHPGVTLIRLLPYHPAERRVIFPVGFDGSFYPPGMESTPRRLAILAANRYMVDHTDYLIAYTQNSVGNSRNLVEYAMKRGSKVLELSNDRKIYNSKETGEAL